MGETNKNNIQEKALGELTLYSEHTHQICRWILKICIILFFVVPIFLIVFCRLSNGDKVMTLLIWIVFMFILAAVQIFVGYFDHRLNLLLMSVHGEDHKNLELIPEINIKNLPTSKEELISAIKSRPTLSNIDAYPDFTDLVEDPETDEIVLNPEKEVDDKDLEEMLEDFISPEAAAPKAEPAADTLTQEINDFVSATMPGAAPASSYTAEDLELNLDDILAETKSYDEKSKADSSAASGSIISDLDAFAATDPDEVEL